MRALAIAPEPFFTARGTPLSVYYRALVMTEQGVEIDLLTYGQGEDVDVPGLRVVRIPRFGLLGPVPVGPSWLKVFLDAWLLVWALALLVRRRYDFVHAHEEAVFLSLLLKPLFRHRLVYDMHSSLPEQLVTFGFTRSRLLVGLFRKLESASLRYADVVITIGPRLSEYAMSRMPDPSRHLLIENTLFDEVRLKSPAKGSLPGSNGGSFETSVSALFEGGRRVIAYAGTFEKYQGLDVLLEAFARIPREAPDATLLLIGGSSRQVASLRNRASELRLDGGCVFTGQLPLSVTRGLLARSDIIVSPRTEGMNTPQKIYELLAHGAVLVATRVPAHTRVLDDTVCFLVEPEAGSMADGLLQALQEETRRARLAANARRRYEERYSRTTYESRIRELLEMVRA